ncbi:MAG TPA: hypothetical protein VFZ58_04150 [Candidatus Saccharimonadales bacterium]
MGWSAIESALHLEFSGPKEFQQRFNLPAICSGGYRSIGFREQLDPDDPTKMLSYRHSIGIPLTPESVTIAGVARLNKTLRHELGHAVCKNRFGKERLYHYLFKDKDDGSYQGKVLGIIPVRTIVSIAEALEIDGRVALHRLDRAERFANRFAKKHRKELNPIRLRK